MNDKKFFVFDMGSAHTPKIVDSIIEIGYLVDTQSYEEITSNYFNKIIKEYNGIIISGSPLNIKDDNFPNLPFDKLPGIPIMAICYGMQLIGHKQGADVIECNNGKGEKGKYELDILEDSILFKGFNNKSSVFHFHEYMLNNIPEGWKLTSSTKHTKIASIEKDDKYFCTQFHPECLQSTRVIIKNFLDEIC